MAEISPTRSGQTLRQWLAPRPWREVSVGAVIVMELCWAVPLYRALSRSASSISALSLYTLFATVAMLAYILHRATHLLGAPPRRVQLASLLLLLVSWTAALWLLSPPPRNLDRPATQPGMTAALASPVVLLPLAFESLALTAWFWHRGMNLAQNWVGTTYINHRLRVGVLFFLLLGFLVALPWGQTPGVELYAFLFAALIAAGAGRAYAVRGGRELPKTPLRGSWVLALLIGAAALVGFSALGADFGSGLVAEVGSRAIYLGLSIFAVALLLLLSPVFFVIFLILPHIVRAIQGWMDLAPLQGRLAEVMRNLMVALVNLMELAREFLGFLRSMLPLRTLVLWGGLLLAILALLRRAGRSWRGWSSSPGPPGERVSVVGRPGVLANLRRVVAKSLAQISADVRRFGRGRKLLHALRIRHIYARLMALCADLGHARVASQTPLEFLPTLHRLFPTHRADTGAITRAYVRVRYGELPQADENLAVLRESWAKIRDYGDSLKRGHALQQIYEESREG